MILIYVVSVDARLDVNVALNRPSYQVSTTHVYDAGKANDGNHDTIITNLHCAAMEPSSNPWWVVDMLVALYVVGVKFTNRGDCCGTYFVSSDTSAMWLKI